MEHTETSILIIDDDTRNVFALSLMLKSKGYHAITAIDATSGIELLKGDEKLRVVLLDMMMPGMDGYEAIPVIRKLRPITIIAVTAQAMEGDREKCLIAGADEYVAKPIDVDLLLEFLDRYV